MSVLRQHRASVIVFLFLAGLWGLPGSAGASHGMCHDPGELCPEGDCCPGTVCGSGGACCVETGSPCSPDGPDGFCCDSLCTGGVCGGAECTSGDCCDTSTNTFKASGTACTDDGNVCTTDTCNGSSATCQHPAGNQGTTCRSAAGDCDVLEQCDGTNTACPADALEPSTKVCRGAKGDCDVAESCPGDSASCPADKFQSEGFICAPDRRCNASHECAVVPSTKGGGGPPPPPPRSSAARVILHINELPPRDCNTGALGIWDWIRRIFQACPTSSAPSSSSSSAGTSSSASSVSSAERMVIGCNQEGIGAVVSRSLAGMFQAVFFIQPGHVPTAQQIAAMCPAFRVIVDLARTCVRPVAVYTGQSCGSAATPCVRSLDDARVMLNLPAGVPAC